MADALDLEVVKRQLTKDILRDLGIEKALQEKYSNLQHQIGQIIDEYGKHYRQLYKYINEPFEQ